MVLFAYVHNRGTSIKLRLFDEQVKVPCSAVLINIDSEVL